jgi:hypothetical protein
MGKKDAAKTGVFQSCLFFFSLSLCPETKEKTFAAASAALTSSVLQQN